jgi:sugar lactone lactonase YvrE
MKRRFIRAGFCAFLAAATVACSQNASLVPQRSAENPGVVDTKSATQYLYVYNTGRPGSIGALYDRYSIPNLALKESTPADGVAGPPAFGATGLLNFIDEASNGGFAAYQQPLSDGPVNADEQFYGVPCQSNSLAIGPNKNLYVSQYCSTNVLEYTPTPMKNKPKKPIATFTGGNLGKSGIIDPTAVAVDPDGNLYVGDNGAGVTYFAKGSKKGTIAFPTFSGGSVNQMVVDKNGDVWSVHGPNPTAVYFPDKTTCKPDPSGTIARNEYAERFSKGKLVQHLYTSITTSKVFTDNGLSIAVDDSGRVYTGNQNSDVPGIVLDFEPGASCPNDALSFKVAKGANPQVAVDAAGRYYVTDYGNNAISVYTGGTTKRIRRVVQPAGSTSITYAAVGP